VPPPRARIDFEAALRLLAEHGVDFVVVGGLAAAAHGAARVTYDLDIVYSRRADNLVRLARALEGVQPYLRGAPAGLPFRWDADTLRHGLNFTLTTSVGDIDLLGEITGGGGFEELLPDSLRVQAYGIECWCLGLEKLIHVKRAAGRPKDLEAIAELEVLLEERRESS
jgi:predicted nucleotidyltransferase